MKLKVKNLDENLLRQFGFTDYNKKNWYYLKRLWKDITINVTIPKNNPERLEIDVLDELILQPYNYEYYRNEEVKMRFEEEINKLIGTGILERTE
jgi:hypothetical protein